MATPAAFESCVKTLTALSWRCGVGRGKAHVGVQKNSNKCRVRALQQSGAMVRENQRKAFARKNVPLYGKLQ